MNEKSELRIKMVIGHLDRAPPATRLFFVVIKRDKEGAYWSDNPHNISQNLPHGASMVQNAPRIDNVKLPETL
jgi:hypothetical protein